jgi:hypothetical protein
VLEHARCDTLADSVAVVIALAVAIPEDEARQQDAVSFGVGAHLSALFGTLPKVAFGAGAAFAIEAPSLRFELRGTFHLPQSASFAGTTLGARFYAISAAARACWLSRLGALELGPCLGADLHYVSATGAGGDVSLSGHGISFGPALGAFGRVNLTKSFGIVLVADGAMLLSRQRFVFGDVDGALHRASLVAAQLLVAPEVHF